MPTDVLPDLHYPASLQFLISEKVVMLIYQIPYVYRPYI